MQIKKWIYNKQNWPVSLFFSLLTLRLLFYSFSYELTSFNELVPGIATFDLIDISKRVSLFKQILFAAPLIFIAFTILFTKLTLVFKNRIFWSFLQYSSLLGIGLYTLEFITSNHESSVYFLLLIQALFLVHSLLNKQNATTSSFGMQSMLAYSMAFIIREILIISFNASQIPWFALLFTSSHLLIQLLGFLLQGTSLPKTSYKALIPLLLIPAFSVISDELYLICNQHNFNYLSADLLYIILLSLTLITSIILFYTSKQHTPLNKRNNIGVLVLASVALFTFYVPIIVQPTEMFELANPANAIMRMIKFSEIPFIHFMNSHVFYDWFYKVIYVLINGYNASLDFLIYDFIDWVLFYVASYWLFKSFFKNGRFAFIAIVFLPFLPLMVYRTLYLVIFNVYFLLLLHKNFSFKNLLLNYFWIAFALFWRLDSGIASLIGSLILTIILLLKNYSKKKLLSFIKASVLSAFVIGVLLLIVNLIWENTFIIAIKQSLAYFGAEQAHGFSQLSPTYNRYFYNDYFIFPFIALVVLLYCIYKIVNIKIEQKSHYNTNSYIILFFTIVYLVNFPRGLVRHSLMGSDMFLNSFIFLIILLFIYELIKDKNKAKWAFLGLALIVVASFKSSDALGYDNLFKQFNKQFSKVTHIENSEHKIVRCQLNTKHAKKTYTDFVKFMDMNFANSATFIDFSNTPMLYFYAQRPVPSYFCQYMQNTATFYLQNENIRGLKNYDIPVVVFSHIPQQWWDATDGVPNTVRYIKTAQYIFENYKPLGNVKGYYLWIKKDVSIKDSSLLKPYKATNDKYILKHYAYALAQHQQYIKSEFITTTAEVTKSTITIKPSTNYQNTYLKVFINNKSEKQQEIEAIYGDSVTSGMFTFTIRATHGEISYTIPLYSQYNWVNSSFKNIDLKLPAKVELMRAEILTDTSSFENK